MDTRAHNPGPTAKTPIPGTTWLHYKGSTYTVLVVAEHTKTGESMVVYQHQGTSKIYTRPLSMWYDDVGEGRIRFTLSPKQPSITDRCTFLRGYEKQIWYTPGPVGR